MKRRNIPFWKEQKNIFDKYFEINLFGVSWSQSYKRKTFIQKTTFFITSLLVYYVNSGVNPYKLCFSLFFRFLPLSLSVCNCISWFVTNEKRCIYHDMAKLNSKKRKNNVFTKKKKFGRIDSCDHRNDYDQIWCKVPSKELKTKFVL